MSDTVAYGGQEQPYLSFVNWQPRIVVVDMRQDSSETRGGPHACGNLRAQGRSVQRRPKQQDDDARL